MRCLVVEDDPDIQADLTRALEAAGFVVDVAADGEAAWYQGDVEDYALAVLDLGLPRLDGLSVLRRWRAAGRAFPVLILSARGDWTEKVEGIEAGADDYMAKPFEMGELVARLRGLVRRGAGLTTNRRLGSACFSIWLTSRSGRYRPSSWPSTCTAPPTPQTPTPSKPSSPACAASSDRR